MSSGRFAEVRTPLMLSILMVLMTQVGYLDTMNPWSEAWSGDEETLDETTDVLETGGQGSANYSLGQSTYGEAFALNTAIEPITFEYRENSDAATIYGNGSLWTVNQPSNFIGRRIANGNGNFSVGDGVFFFDKGSCAISMHNTSNGTTWEAFSISPCSDSWSSSVFVRESFFVSGEHFLFQLYDGSSSEQIWAHNISNGTSWRIGGGAFSDTSGYLRSQDELFQHGNDFWFWGFESGSRSQLYRINGSTMEVEVRSNFTDSCGAYPCSYSLVKGWAASNGSIYFIAKSTAVGHKAYFHDIATNQTSLAFDINPSGSGVYGLMQVSDDLLFVNGRNTSSSGLKLWAHNTTTNQTYLQSDITPSLPRLDIGATNPLIDDVYYFYATNTSTGNELHAYSIVNNSTWLVEDIQPGSVGSLATNTLFPPLQAYEGKLFILADDGTNGDQVWVHDPSTAETYRLTNLGVDVDNIQRLVGDTLYFSASKMGYPGYLYAHSMSTNSTYEVPNFPDGRYYQTGTRFFLPVNGTIYMNGGHGPATNSNAWTPIQALVAWSPSEFTPMTTPVAGATCSVSSTLPSGLALNQGNCTVSGTPTVVTPQSNYTITATINGQTYGATFSLITDYLPMRPSVAELEASIGVAITNISFGGFGEPGDGGYGEPVNYNYQSIYAGHDGYCFILETGELRCDGNNYIEGQGNIAAVTGEFVEPSLPADAVVKHVLPGASSHVCAILVNGSLYCWGGNYYGQLGNGNYNAQYTPVHIPLPTGRTVEKISADHEFTCALLDNGSIMCWGRNHEGQLGRGTTATSGQNSPGYVSILPQGRHAVDVGVGSEHVCALLDNNDVVCWGSNNSMTGSSSITVPHTVPFPSNQSVLSIAAIGKVSCALMDNGSVRCWGSNAWYHALGVTGASTTGTPTLTATMPGGLNATALIAHHDGVCATLENFSIACWGAIQYTHVVEPTIPSFPYGSMQITSFAASYNKACYALENGSLWCGSPSTGAGDFIDIESPIQSSLPTLISGATCSISPPLPSGLSLTQGTCKIIGTPTALASNKTYAVFANKTEGTYRGEVNIAVVGEPLYPSVEGAELILDEAMTNITFQYNASAASGSGGGSGSGSGTTTNGNGTVWQVSQSLLLPGFYMEILVGDTLYFSATDGSSGSELWAHDTSNASTWQVADIRSGAWSSEPGKELQILVGDTIYFDADDGSSGKELWAHNTSNASTWRVADINSGSQSSTTGLHLNILVGDTLYFSAWDGSSGHELWAHDTSNASTWRVTDIDSGTGSSYPGQHMAILVGDTLYFDADGGSSGIELWAHDTSNASTWRVTDIDSGTGSSYPGQYMAVLVGDTLYFSAWDGSSGEELWAHDTSNASTWRVADIYGGATSSHTGQHLEILVGDTIYFSANDGSTGVELWAHDTSNASTWRVADIRSGSSSTPGQYMEILVGDTLYFSANDGSSGTELWAHDTSNASTWRVADIRNGVDSSLPGQHMEILVGDTLYFSANDGSTGVELWAHDTSNASTWRVADIRNGVDSSLPGDYMQILVGDTLYFSARNGSSSTELWAHQPGEITSLSSGSGSGGMTNVTGATCTVSPSLPTGLSIDSSTCTISGTPTVATSNTTYTVTANISNVTYQGSVWLSTSTFGTITSAVEGAHLNLGEAMTPLTLNYTVNANGGVSTITWETHPALPAGMSISGGTISGTPSVYATNQTYTIYANQSGYSTTQELYFSVDTTNAHTVVENQTIDPIGFHPPFWNGTTTWTVSPALPGNLSINGSTGEITGMVNGTLAQTTYTMTATHNGSATETFSLDLRSLSDIDGDGLPDDLPGDYDPAEGPTSGLVADGDDDGDGTCDGPVAIVDVCAAGPDAFPLDPSADTDTDGDGMPDTIDGNSTSQPPLVEDMDDDGDGLEDVNETDTGIYNGSTDTGTDPLDPDTDNDGICDGPNAVPPICVAGPDISPLGEAAVGDIYALNNTLMASLSPADRVPGGTFEIVPDLPAGLTMDPLTGIISGTPTETMESTNFNVYSNSSTMSTSYSFDLTVLGDFDMDGMPDELPDDYPDTGVEPYTLIEDEDDDNDGLLDTNESIIGTDPFNPDTDGDGFCDGNLSVANVCSAGPDPYPLDPNAPVDTDGDGLPDELPPGYEGELLEDEDDDNDGFSDLSELACNSDSKNASSIPNDMDGDAICDSDDPDRDGDGIENEAEIGESLGGTDSNNPDTDGDGVCDGPSVPANGGCLAGPDAFPLDPAGALDTDGDGKPDDLLGTSTSEPPLVEDLDDDGDTWPDAMELLCGTYPKVASSVPADTDGDGICDALDDVLDLPFKLEYPTQYVDLFVNQTMEPLLPFVNGSGEVVTWELEGELPEGLTFGWSPARDASMDGSIRGTPTNATETLNLIVWANNSFYSESFSLSLTVFNDSDNDSLPDELPEGYLGNLTADPDDDNDGLSDAEETTCGSNPLDAESGRDQWMTVCLDLNSGDDDDGFGWIWCFPCLLLLLLLLIIPLLLGRDRFLVMLADGPEPENTTAEPNFVAGSGTEDDPFILAPVGPLQPGSMESTVEEITITNMADIKIDMVDFNDEDNYGRFSMYESDFSMEGSRILAVGKDGEVVINFKFDDREFPTYEGGTYTGRIKLGKASVYFLWEVTVMADERKAETEKKQTMSRIKKRKKAFDFERIGKATKKNADDLQTIKGIGPYSEEKLNALGIFTYAQLANFDRKTEDEVNDAIEHYKGRIRRDEWVKQARDIIGAEAKADEEALKAAEEAQAKAEAEAKAAEEAETAKKAEEAAVAKAAKEEAAAAALAEKEAKDAEKKAKAEADKKAKEEAATKKKAEEEAKKAKAAEEKAAKDAEKKAKAEADKKAKEEAAAKKKAEEEAKKAAAAKPVTKETKKEEELKRVKERSKSIDFKVLGTAKASDKDDLQAIRGIGPFIEEKLNALGIYTWLQISKMTDKLEDQVNEAIEFFPGRVKRDQWVNQAKILLGEDVKLDEKAIKQAEELARVAAKAESIDFATLGVASASEKDDLQAIKGIGPFIEEKLYALGIYTYEQVSKMTAKIEDEVNVAIEFFPGRVKRDEWAKQAKKLHKDKK